MVVIIFVVIVLFHMLVEEFAGRKPESVLEEIDKIANKGIKEVVITGIQVSSYGKDFDNNYRLIDLLEEINKIRG